MRKPDFSSNKSMLLKFRIRNRMNFVKFSSLSVHGEVPNLKTTKFDDRRTNKMIEGQYRNSKTAKDVQRSHTFRFGKLLDIDGDLVFWYQKTVLVLSRVRFDLSHVGAFA